MESDVVIIGAGLAGLNAARHLVRAGVRVQVVEARDRVGGRTWSAPLYQGSVFDLGGQWVGPAQTRVLTLADELGIQRSPTPVAGTRVMELWGKRRTYTGDIPPAGIVGLVRMQLAIWMMESQRRKIPLDAPWDGPGALEFDQCTVDSWARRHGRDVHGLVQILTRSVWSAEPQELSLLYFLHYIHAAGGFDPVSKVENGAQMWRLVGGAQGLSKGLAAAVGPVISYNSPVRQVVQDSHGVRVVTPTGEFSGRFLVCAIPPALAWQIDWQPALPTRREQLTQRCPMGYTIKCLALYQSPFWKEKRLSGEGYSNTGPVTFTYDNTSYDGKQPALVAFVVGNHARRLGDLPPQHRKSEILSAIARLLGPESLEPEFYHEQNWNMERWSGGCPVGISIPGMLSSVGPSLREIAGRIHFAGTETATQHVGYMDGALQSGERVAGEILARI